MPMIFEDTEEAVQKTLWFSVFSLHVTLLKKINN